MYCWNRFKQKSQKTQFTFFERKYEGFRPDKVKGLKRGFLYASLNKKAFFSTKNKEQYLNLKGIEIILRMWWAALSSIPLSLCSLCHRFFFLNNF